MWCTCVVIESIREGIQTQNVPQQGRCLLGRSVCQLSDADSPSHARVRETNVQRGEEVAIQTSGRI